MAKTNNAEAQVTSIDTKKKRKKLAKKEAKLMLEIDQAKKGVEKAKKKITGDQEKLQTRTDSLNQLEQKLSELQAASNKQALQGISVPQEEKHATKGNTSKVKQKNADPLSNAETATKPMTIENAPHETSEGMYVPKTLSTDPNVSPVESLLGPAPGAPVEISTSKTANNAPEKTAAKKAPENGSTAKATPSGEQKDKVENKEKREDEEEQKQEARSHKAKREGDNA